MGQLARAEDANAPDGLAQIRRQLPQGNAGLARDEVGMQYTLAAFGFECAFQRAQRRHTPARRNLQPDVRLADGQRHHAV